MKSYNLFSIDYKIEYGKPVIYLFCRDRYGRRKVLKEENFIPHFYVAAKERPDLPVHPVKTIDGNDVVKIETRFPRDVPEESKKYKFVYENNILFPLVFLIDRGIYCGVTDDLKPAPELEVKPRVMYIDTEVSVEDDSILVITFYDSYTGQMQTISRQQYDEPQLLLEFINNVRRIDPDIITAWNVHFDLQVFVERCKILGLDFHNLSPLHYVTIRKMRGKYGEKDEVKISGRTVFDLWDAYRKFFQGKTFESDKLEDIVHADLGIKPINFDYVNKCNINYLDVVISLNKHHVQIEYLLDQHWGLIQTFETMRRTVGCLLNQTLVTSQYGDVLVLRECKGTYVLPGKVGPVIERETYQGAYVHHPPTGVYENVAVLDIAAMYPSLIRAFNLSPETLVVPDTLGEKPDVECYQVGPFFFRKKPLGIYPRIIEKLQTVRAQVKAAMKKERDKQKYKILWTRQYALKQAIAALYGLTALPAFRLFKQEVAMAITTAGRELVKSLIKKTSELGYTVLYSDTDSIHVKVDNYDEGRRLEKILNDYLYDTFINQLDCYIAPELEYEKLYTRILYVGVKKRYVGVVDGEIEYKGFEIKKSSSAQITRDLQKAIFNRLLIDQDIDSIKQLMKSIKQEISTYPLEYLAIPQPLNKEVSQYEKPAQRKAIIATEQKTGRKFKRGEKPKKIPVKWIGEDEGVIWIGGKKYPITEMVLVDGKLPEGAIPNYEEIFEKSVWKPVERILHAIGLDRDTIYRGTYQTDLFNFEPKNI